MKKIIGIVLLVIGICLYLFSGYISTQVAQGQQKIVNTQKNVNRARGLTNLSPYTKDIGNVATQPIQQKIDQGKQEVAQYQALANWLRLGGVICIVAGVVLFVFGTLGKKSQ